jgi:hypothetical protein
MSARFSGIGLVVPSTNVSPAGSVTEPDWFPAAAVVTVVLCAFPAPAPVPPGTGGAEVVAVVAEPLPAPVPLVVVDAAADDDVVDPGPDRVVAVVPVASEPGAPAAPGVPGAPGAVGFVALVAVVPEPRRLLKCPPARMPELVEDEGAPAAWGLRASRAEASPAWA